MRGKPGPDRIGTKLLPPPDTLRESRLGWADLLVFLAVLTLLALIGRAGSEAMVSFQPPDVGPTVSLDPRPLPDYALRSSLRMVIALFPGSLLGLEAASIFAIFTSQVWNMTFSFYQSLRTVPPELIEATSLYRLSRWQRFSRLELPSAAIPLLWSAMMRFGGGWLFLAASEAISVLNQSYTLPGIGCYVAAAVAARDRGAVDWGRYGELFEFNASEGRLTLPS